MTYTIHKADGTAVNIPDNIIDTAYYNPTGGSAGTGLGIQLLGQNSVSYGAAVAQNFLQMQENYSNSSFPSDATALQGQLWFNKASGTTGSMYVRTSGATSGGIANWRQLVNTDASGNVVVSGTVTATQFIGPVSGVSGGAANQIVVQTGASATGFIPAPSVGGTFLEWNGSAFIWTTTPATGTVTSVAVSSPTAAITVSGSPITSSGTITLTANNFTSSAPGVVPTSPGGTTNFLRADGTWAVPPGTAPGGTVTSVGVSSSGANSSSITISGSPVTSSGNITITPNTFTSGAPGVVPASGGSSANFLRADGVWTAPPVNGTVTSVGLTSSGGSAGAITVSGSPITSSGAITIIPNQFTSGAPGVVPASGGGTTNYLRADGTWSPSSGVQLSDFTGTNQSLGVSSGYQKFPGGLIMQWAQITTTPNQNVFVPYPITFPTTSYIPTWTVLDTTGENFPDQIVASIAGFTTSGCTVKIGVNGGDGGRTFTLSINVLGL